MTDQQAAGYFVGVMVVLWVSFTVYPLIVVPEMSRSFEMAPRWYSYLLDTSDCFSVVSIDNNIEI